MKRIFLECFKIILVIADFPIMVRCLFCILLTVVSSFVYADDIAGSDLTRGSVSQGSSVKRPLGCGATEFFERQELFNSCQTRFADYGISKVIRPDQIVNRNSCPSIENKTLDIAAGCAQYGVEATVGTLMMIVEVSGINEHSAAVGIKCGPYPMSVSKDQKRAQRLHKECAVFTAREENLRQKREAGLARKKQAAHDRQMYAITTECNKRFIGQGRANALRNGNPKVVAAHRDCQLELAAKKGCESCVQELKPEDLDLGSAVVAMVEQELARYSSFQCYNGRTQGHLICETIGAIIENGVGSVAKGGLTLVTRKLGSEAIEAARRKMRKALRRQTRRGVRNQFPGIPKGYHLIDVYDIQRKARAVGVELDHDQAKAALRAHAFGLEQPSVTGGAAAFGEYTKRTLAQERRMMVAAGIPKAQATRLIETGVAGAPMSFRKKVVAPIGPNGAEVSYDSGNTVFSASYSASMKAGQIIAEDGIEAGMDRLQVAGDILVTRVVEKGLPEGLAKNPQMLERLKDTLLRARDVRVNGWPEEYMQAFQSLGGLSFENDLMGKLRVFPKRDQLSNEQYLIELRIRLATIKYVQKLKKNPELLGNGDGVVAPVFNDRDLDGLSNMADRVESAINLMEKKIQGP